MKNGKKEILAKEMAGTIFKLKRMGWTENFAGEIRMSEFFLLAALIRQKESGKEEVKASDLSASLNITPGGATHMINTLEEKGYLKRVSTVSDRRVVFVEATKKGADLVHVMKNKIYEKMKKVVDVLGEKGCEEFLRLAAAVYHYLQEEKNEFG